MESREHSNQIFDEVAENNFEKKFISNFIKNVVEQNESKLKLFFNDSAQILWPCTNEKFDVSEYIIANCKYPGNWNGNIVKMESFGDSLVVIFKIYTVDLEFFVTSFITLKENRIECLEEYWSEIGRAPQWRRDLNIGKEINESIAKNDQ